MDKSIKMRKGVVIQHIAVSIETRVDACGKTPHRKGGYKHSEESLKASTTTYLQLNETFGGP